MSSQNGPGRAAGKLIDDSDRAFRDSVESCRFPGGSFGHEEHVRLAWIYLQEYDTDEATARCRRTLSRFAAFHGDRDKYHDTLTGAFMHLIARHVAETPEDEDWTAFRARVRPLFESARELIDRHYSKEHLGRPEARKTFLPPDREPL